MKYILSLVLAAVLAASVLASCVPAPASAASSSDLADSAWLEARLGEIPANVTIGTAESLGIDMTDFEDDGYFIRTGSGETVVCGKTADGLDRAVRRYAKDCESGCVADVIYHEGYRVKKLTVAGRDVDGYSIVIPADADECLTYAASELRGFIKSACGAELTVTCDVPADKRCFMLVPCAKDGDLGEDGFEISVTAPTVTIRGGEVRGCLFGVYDLLEDVIGYRFFTYYDTFLYDVDVIDIPDGFTVREVPRFSMRNVRDRYTRYLQQVDVPISADDHGEYVVQRKGTSPSMNKACFGWNTVQKASHNLGTLCGTDRSKQPCLCDDDLYDTAMEKIMASLDSAAASGMIGKGTKEVNLGQEDNPRFCECKACRAKKNKYASQAGVVVDFANRVAEDVGEKYPTVYISIYAYWGAIEPPKNIEIHPMVCVCYVMLGACSHHPFDCGECDPSILFQERMNDFVHKEYIGEWSRLTKNLIIYYYGVNYGLSLSPIMNYDDYCRNYRFFASFDIMGVTCENEASMLTFDQMSTYLMFLLSWDPYMSEDTYYAKMREFMACFYGDGWESLYTYLINVCRAKDRLPCFEDNPFDWFAENYETLCSLFDDALKNCDSAEQEKRIELLSLHMKWGALCGMYDARYLNGSPDEKELMQSISYGIRDTLTEHGITVIDLSCTKKTADVQFDLAEADPHYWINQ